MIAFGDYVLRNRVKEFFPSVLYLSLVSETLEKLKHRGISSPCPQNLELVKEPMVVSGFKVKNGVLFAVESQGGWAHRLARGLLAMSEAVGSWLWTHLYRGQEGSPAGNVNFEDGVFGSVRDGSGLRCVTCFFP